MVAILRSFLVAGLLAAALPASADPEAVEIRLGQPPPPPARPDRAKVQAVTRFLSARQAGSIDAGRKGEARRLLSCTGCADDATLLGRRGTRLIAFDFSDEAIEPSGSGRFTVPVFLLFADRDGSVVESRDERLTFAAQGGDYRCTALRVTNEIAWDSGAVSEIAVSLGAADALDLAQAFLRGWSGRERRATGFSVADITPGEAGSLLVQCRRFVADPGRRGYDVSDSPLVLRRSGDRYHVESN